MTGNKILFLPCGREIPVESESSVLEVALKHKIAIPHSCGGMGSCTTCRVFVEQSPQALPHREEMEQDIAQMRGFAENERLSCQLPPLPGLVVRVPESVEGPEET